MKKFLLAIASLSVTAFASAQSCSELFISEYVEGTSHSKALEIYNPTPDSIDLTNYRLVRYSNGSPTGVDSITLTGYIHAHDVWVVVNGQATPDGNGAFCDPVLMAMGDQVGPSQYVTGTAVMYMNGDDAIVLARITPYAIIDIFGKIGEQPASAWSDVYPYNGTVGTWWTKDHTLIRKPSVTGGVTVNPTVFNVTLEWDSLPVNDWDSLGSHTSVCSTVGIAEPKANASVLSAFPNPSNGNVTLTANAAISTTEVYNSLGELVAFRNYGKAAQATRQELDLSGMPAGLYFVQAVLANGQRVTTRISIQ